VWSGQEGPVAPWPLDCCMRGVWRRHSIFSGVWLATSIAPRLHRRRLARPSVQACSLLTRASVWM
jgi:hypothetical protein